MLPIANLSRNFAHKTFPTALLQGGRMLPAPSLPFYQSNPNSLDRKNRIFSLQKRDLHLPIFCVGVMLTSMNHSMGPVIMIYGALVEDDTDDES